MAEVARRTVQDTWPELGAGPGCNVAVHGGTVHLKVVTEQRTLLHLVPASGAGGGSRPAFRARGRHVLELVEDLAPFDPVLLLEPIWTKRTMCGLIWSQMATYALELDLTLASPDTPQGDGFVCQVCAASALAAAAARASRPDRAAP